MAADLGETGDPRELIPGNPASLTSTYLAWRQYGDALHQAGTGLNRIDTTDGWSGAAGDAFRAKFQGQPGTWLEAGDCFHDAAAAWERYTSTLEWAQGRAAEAIRQWDNAQAAKRHTTMTRTNKLPGTPCRSTTSVNRCARRLDTPSIRPARNCAALGMSRRQRSVPREMRHPKNLASGTRSVTSSSTSEPDWPTPPAPSSTQ